MKIVLDTHILIYCSNDQVSESRKILIEQNRDDIYFSIISLWEITKLVEHKRIKVNSLDDYLNQIYYHPNYHSVSLDPQLMSVMVKISKQMHKDPADQMITATAKLLDAYLMTDDTLIRKQKIVRTL